MDVLESAERVVPVILCGGSGTRLWPISRERQPKALLAMAGAQTMLRQTLSRVADQSRFEAPLIVANEAHAGEIERQAEAAGIAIRSLILEPAGRNTAPAIALAALAASPEAVLLVLPSDHLIADPEALMRAVDTAAPLARDGWLVTFGMAAERPETGYGYIQRGEEIAPGAWRASRFVEKPDSAAAEAFCRSGDYDWNGGIFLFSAGALLEQLRQHAPDVLAAARSAIEAARADGVRLQPDRAAFESSPSVSIDYAVMEHADRIAVVPVSAGWSDLGSWDALYDVAERDESGVATIGNVIALDSRNSLIRGEGIFVAAIGIEDLVVVATPDAVLVMPRGDSQKVKDAVEALKRDRPELL
jgi:mannose-1-phosphate guanylyltransferase